MAHTVRHPLGDSSLEQRQPDVHNRAAPKELAFGECVARNGADYSGATGTPTADQRSLRIATVIELDNGLISGQGGASSQDWDEN